jgi:hypothetical protein
VDEERVRFTWKDYRNGNRVRPMSLPGCEFKRRFLLHVLPKGFVRIRRYGILANCQREDRLALCRLLLGVSPAPVLETEPSAADPEDEVQTSGTAEYLAPRCEACGQGRMRVVEIIRAPARRSRGPPARVGS